MTNPLVAALGNMIGRQGAAGPGTPNGDPSQGVPPPQPQGPPSPGAGIPQPGMAPPTGPPGMPPPGGMPMPGQGMGAQGVPQGPPDPGLIQTSQGPINLSMLSPEERQQIMMQLQSNPGAPVGGAPGMGGGQPQDIESAVNMARSLSAGQQR